MNLVPDDRWTGSHDALPSPEFVSRQLPAVISGGLRDAYAGVLSEGIPEELARCLQRLEPERERSVVGNACAPAP